METIEEVIMCLIAVRVYDQGEGGVRVGIISCLINAEKKFGNTLYDFGRKAAVLSI